MNRRTLSLMSGSCIFHALLFMGPQNTPRHPARNIDGVCISYGKKAGFFAKHHEACFADAERFW
jgi:hypothetical protein